MSSIQILFTHYGRGLQPPCHRIKWKRRTSCQHCGGEFLEHLVFASGYVTMQPFQRSWLEHQCTPRINSADSSTSQWLGMTLTVLFVFIRIGSKWIVLRKWNADDTMIIVTMVGTRLPYIFPGLSISGACYHTYHRNLVDGRQRTGATSVCSRQYADRIIRTSKNTSSQSTISIV